MNTIRDVADFLETFAPSSLAEDWDNVGLLVGDPAAEARRVMTCLTVTPESAAEAIERETNLIVSHHPLPFQPLNRLTTESTPGRLLWQLIRAGVSIYSPHTAFDSAREGINQQLAEAMGLVEISPLVPSEDDAAVGAARDGRLPKAMSMAAISSRLKTFVAQPMLRGVPASPDAVQRIAVACGSAGQFLKQAQAKNCQLLVTGEASFHTCLEAQALGIGLLLLGHFSSERFAVVSLAERLQQALPNLEVWASERERDPIQTL